jgi:hypothetical protein
LKVRKKVKDTALARKMNPDFEVSDEEGFINIWTTGTLVNSVAGRLQIAENMLQMGLISSPEEYMKILNGDFDEK